MKRSFLLTIIAGMSVSLCGCQQPGATTGGPVDEKVPFATVPAKTQALIHAVSDLYGDADFTNGISVTKTVTDNTNHQPMYSVFVQGHFHKGGSGADSKVTATRLSFSVLADGTQLWALLATDDNKAVVWQQHQFTVKTRDQTFAGKTSHWAGEYHIIAGQIFTEGSPKIQYGSWETDSFRAKYIGTETAFHGPVKASLDTTASMCSIQERAMPADRVLTCGGGSGNGAVPNVDAVMKAVVDWNGREDSIVLIP